MPTKMVDSRNAANMKFDNVTVSANMLIGEEDNAFDLINSVLDISRAAISAEMLGSALQAYEITLDYLKEREQFGSKIGSFNLFNIEQQSCFLNWSFANPVY